MEIRPTSSAAPMRIVGLRRMNAATRATGEAAAGRASSAVVDVSAISSVPDARIEECVGDVDGEVDQYFGGGEHDDETMYDRVVALQHRIDRKATKARDVEYRLCDDNARDEKSEADADHGNDWDRGVLQSVHEQDATCRQPLGVGGPNVILSQHLQHRGARHAGDESHIRHAERQ